MKATLPCLLLVLLGWLATPMTARAQSADSLFHLARHQAFDQHDFNAAIQTCKSAIQLSPTDPDYQVFLGRLYAWTHQPDSARAAFTLALQSHPGYEDAKSALIDLDRLVAALHRRHEDSSGNRIGLSYDYTWFDRQYPDPWQLTSLEYSRQTSAGSVIGWVNYANRFRKGGVQFEAEAYPHLSKTFYGYLDLGYSPDATLFPAWRGGASLYANLPHAMEADAGFRYLYFSSATMLYTFSLGKYYKNYWFNARCWLVPGQGGTSQSVTLTARYYTGGADDYLSIAAGSGLSPDDNTNNVQLAAPYRLSTQKLQCGWRHAFHRHIVFAGVQWFYQEYLPDTHGHQWDLGCGYLYRF